MSLSYMCGFETGTLLGEAPYTTSLYVIGGVGEVIPTVVNTIVHGGGGLYSMHCNPTNDEMAAEFACERGSPQTGSQPVFCSVRFYMYVATLPNVQTAIYSGERDGLAYWQTLYLNPDGTLTISDGAGAFTNSTLQLTTGAWHQISLAVNPNDGSNAIDLYVDGTLWAHLTSTPQNTTVYDVVWIGPGIGGTTCTCDLYIDDILWDDGATGEVNIGPGYQQLLLPTADVSRGNWTAGAGGTTNLWEALKNIPPQGKVSGSETNTTQIKDGSKTVPSDYTATMESYTAAGISTTINAVAALAITGAETASTSLIYNNGQLWIASNPAQGIQPASDEFGYSSGGINQIGGNFPGNFWYPQVGVLVPNPTVDLNTAPTVTVQKTVDGSSKKGSIVDDVCFLGVYVDHA